MRTNELADALKIVGDLLAPPGETTTLFIGPDTAEKIRQALNPNYIPAHVNEFLRHVLDQEAERIDGSPMHEVERHEETLKVNACEQWLERFTQAAPGTSQAPSQGEPGQSVIPPGIYMTLRNALDIAAEKADDQTPMMQAEAWLDTFTFKNAAQSTPEQLTVKVNPSEQSADQPDLPCVRRFPTTERDRQIVQLAIEQCDQDGVCEVDTDAMISEAAGAEGCYVQAWVWTAFDGKVQPLPAVEMPPKSALKCGCEHHGIMSGCPVHGSAPSAFNINPGGNPQL